MASNKTSIDCVPGALPGGLQRTSFFNGMFLTQKDLEVEQRFWRMKRRLSNKTLAGKGVCFGLRVGLDQTSQKLTLNAGYAVDCCGNDLIVQSAHETRCDQLVDLSDPELQALLKQDDNEVALVLEYVECPEEPRPVHKDACQPSADSCQSSRVRETTRLKLAALPSAATSPIAGFVAGVDALRSGLQKSNDPLLGEIFPDTLPATASADRPLPFQLRVRLGGATSAADATDFLQSPNPKSAAPGLAAVFSYPPSQPETLQLQFELVPDAGYVFYDGSVQEVVPAVANSPKFSVAVPFDLALAWSFTLPLPANANPAVKQRLELAFGVSGLSFAKLFGGDRMRVGDFGVTLNLTVDVLAASDAGPTDTTCHVCVEGIALRAPMQGQKVVATSAGALSSGPCLEPLGKGFSLDGLENPGDAPKTILLAALYGWLSNSFGSTHGYPQGNDVKAESFDGQRILASWLYLTAWRLLFGADAAAPHAADARKKLALLLDTLMAEWCSGFFYVGPRCGSDFHGVVLGTAVVSKTGLFKSFDLWKGRRWVVAPPLLQHWGGQLGLAPLDVVAGRLVTSICCLGLGDKTGVTVPSMALPALPDAVMPTWSGALQAPGSGSFNLRKFGQAGILLSDGCYLLFGSENDVNALLKSDGVAFESRTLGLGEFVQRLLRALAAPPQQGQELPRNYVLYRIETLGGAQPMLAIAGDAPEAGASETEHARVRVVIDALIEDYQEAALQNLPKGSALFSPLALPSLADFFTELMFDIPLFTLRPALLAAMLNPNTIEAVLVDLAKAGIETCADVLALGLEQLSNLVAHTDADHDARDPVAAALFRSIIDVTSVAHANAASVWDSARRGAIEGVGTIEKTAPRLFRRSDLLKNEFLEPVVKRLGSFLKIDVQDLVHCAAARAVQLAPSA